MKDDATIPDVRAALLARVLWGVVNGSAVEVRPGGVVSFDDAVAHVTVNLGAAAAQRICSTTDDCPAPFVCLPDLGACGVAPQ